MCFFNSRPNCLISVFVVQVQSHLKKSRLKSRHTCTKCIQNIVTQSGQKTRQTSKYFRKKFSLKSVKLPLTPHHLSKNGFQPWRNSQSSLKNIATNRFFFGSIFKGLAVTTNGPSRRGTRVQTLNVEALGGMKGSTGG